VATILFTWELGQGFGHLALLRPIGLELEARGHRIVVASQNVTTAHKALPAHWPVYQSILPPNWTKPPDAPKRTGSYAEILQARGLANADTAAAIINGWGRLFDLVQPDVLVAETSPMALAAALGRLPRVVLGNGFAMPPTHLPEFPPLTPSEAWQAPHEAAWSALEGALAATGRPALSALPQLYAADLRICATLPPFDPYAEWRRDELYGLIEPLQPAAGNQQPGERIFAYLNGSYPQTDEVLTAIAGNASRFSLYVTDMPAGMNEQLRERGSVVYDSPADYAEVLPQAKAVMSHGNLRTSMSAMAVGRPQLLVPVAMERQLTADYVVSTGAGLILTGINRGKLKKAIDRFVDDEQVAERARAASHELHRIARYVTAGQCADGVEAVLQRAGG